MKMSNKMLLCNIALFVLFVFFDVSLWIRLASAARMMINRLRHVFFYGGLHVKMVNFSASEGRDLWVVQTNWGLFIFLITIIINLIAIWRTEKRIKSSSTN